MHDDLHADDPMIGLSPRIVVDMHKFLAAAHVTKEDLQPSLALLDGLKTVAGMSSSCSPRVNLMLRSSNQLKTGFQNWGGLQLFLTFVCSLISRLYHIIRSES